MIFQEPNIKYVKPCKHRLHNSDEEIAAYEKGDFPKERLEGSGFLCMLQSKATKQSVGVSAFACAQCMLRSDEPDMNFINKNIQSAFNSLLQRTVLGFIPNVEDVKHVFSEAYPYFKTSSKGLMMLAGHLEQCVELGRITIEEAVALVDKDMEELKNAPDRATEAGRQAARGETAKIRLNPHSSKVRASGSSVGAGSLDSSREKEGT